MTTALIVEDDDRVMESIADTLFMVGIGLMGIIGVVFAFELV